MPHQAAGLFHRIRTLICETRGRDPRLRLYESTAQSGIWAALRRRDQVSIGGRVAWPMVEHDTLSAPEAYV